MNDADLKTGVEYAHKTNWIIDTHELCTLAAGKAPEERYMWRPQRKVAG